MGQSSSGNQTTTQAPWKAQRPYLREGMDEAQRIYQQGAPGYYPGSTIADPSATTQMGWQATIDRALNGNIAQQYGQQNVANTAAGGYLGQNPGMALYQEALAQNNPAMALNALFGVGGTPEQQALTQAGMQGFQNEGIDLLSNTARGGFLNNNPYLDDMFDRAAGAVEDRFRTITAPQTDAAARMAGVYGGSDYQRMRGLNEQALAGELGGLATDIYSQNYARERSAMDNAQNALAGYTQAGQNQQLQALMSSLGTQLQGTGQLGQNFQNAIGNVLAAGGQMDAAFANERANMNAASQLGLGYGAADYNDLAQLLGIGGQMDRYNQANIDADIDRYNYESNKEWQNLANYMNMIQGNYGGTMTTSAGGGGVHNALTGALGGGLSGAALMAALGLGGPYAGAAAGVGGLLGLLG